MARDDREGDLQSPYKAITGTFWLPYEGLMTPADRNYLQGVLDAYVDVSIQRIAHSGVLSYRYRLSGAELRGATGRQRLHEAIIDDVTSFFANANADAGYDAKRDTFDIVVDLNNCILNRQQAEFLSVAMTTFRELV